MSMQISFQATLIIDVDGGECGPIVKSVRIRKYGNDELESRISHMLKESAVQKKFGQQWDIINDDDNTIYHIMTDETMGVKFTWDSKLVEYGVELVDKSK